MGRTSCELACGDCEGAAAVKCKIQAAEPETRLKANQFIYPSPYQYTQQYTYLNPDFTQDSDFYANPDENDANINKIFTVSADAIDTAYSNDKHVNHANHANHVNHAIHEMYSLGERFNRLDFIPGLNGCGCGGICIRFDTRSCRGKRCASCEVFKAGLCCKRYLTNNVNQNAVGRDSVDYWHLMADFYRRLKSDKKLDDGIYRKLMFETIKSNEFRDEMRRMISCPDEEALTLEWREFTLSDLFDWFPNIDRRPVRFEIQLLIYLFYNYRCQIDLEHAEERFQIPKLAINRCLRAFFGYSYAALLMKLRNEYSKILMRIPSLRIGEIGLLAGYKSHLDFTQNFTRYEQVSPSKFRQTLKRSSG